SYLNAFLNALMAGRMLYPTDTVHELIVNETMVRKLGFTNDKDILGKTISFDPTKKLPIVGVMHDFSSKSLKEAVSPFILATNIHAYNYIALRINPESMQSTLAQMEKTFTHTFPTYM